MNKDYYLTKLEELGPKGFRNVILNDPHFANLFASEIEQYGKKYSEILYRYKHNNPTSQCKMCGQPTKFKNYIEGFKTYCTLECSRSDGSKTSQEMREIGTRKRRVKMTEILNDPVRGKEYRKKISKKSKEYMRQPHVRKRYSDNLKKRILCGDWTPSVTDSWTHWTTIVDGKKYRSMFEGLFVVYHNHFKGNNLEYEKLRIPYILNREDKVYIVDFIDQENNYVYEIKPASLDNDKIDAKERALQTWCKENSYSYEKVTETELMKYLIEMEDCDFSHEFIDDFKEKYKWNS